MGITDEKKQILQMLQENKVNVDEAVKLLAAVENRRTEEPADSRNIVIKVTEHGQNRANVNIPVGLARMALRVVPKEVFEAEDIDAEALLANVEAGIRGRLVEIEQPDEHRRIEIYVE